MAFLNENLIDAYRPALQIPTPPKPMQPQHVHHFVPMRTEWLQQDGRSIEIVSDIYCIECGESKHLE